MKRCASLALALLAGTEGAEVVGSLGDYIVVLEGVSEDMAHG